MTDCNDRIVRMTLEYDGTRYAGWQTQINARSLQDTVEQALQRFLQEPIRVTASGRTDGGVHARAQVISFITKCDVPAEAINRGLLKYLPGDITPLETADAPAGFDARRSATMRWYRFFLCNRRPRPALGSRYLTHVPQALDVDVMRQVAAMFEGDHDFRAFRAITCSAKRTALTMQPIVITEREDGILALDFQCRSFLHNMVRILTGTMVNAGRGKISVEQIQHMLDTGDRHIRAVTLQPQGLFLWRVFYGDEWPVKSTGSSGD